MSIDEERGKNELIEKGMAIGRILTINTESLYHLNGLDLLKATIRSAALQGYGYIRVLEFQADENLIVHPADISSRIFISTVFYLFRGLLPRNSSESLATRKYAHFNLKRRS